MKRLLLALMFLWLAALAQPALAADTVYYYYTNTLHSTVVETDAQGNVVEQTTHYAPYGQVLNRSMRDGPGYTGHEEDPATGLNYMQQRYYDPQSGRFVSTDPVVPADNGENFNRYEYANDNPYRYTDPDGRESGAGYATGDYTMALPPSSPEAREAALTMAGVVVVVAGVTGPDEAVGAGALLRAGVRYVAGKVAGAIVRRAAAGAAKGDLHAPGDVRDSQVIVRGGASEMPKPGNVFSGSQGSTIEDAARGVPHGQIRTSTAGEIRANGGTVDVAPEPTRSGQINGQHVNVIEGGQKSAFSEPRPNPVPKKDRTQ